MTLACDPLPLRKKTRFFANTLLVGVCTRCAPAAGPLTYSFDQQKNIGFSRVTRWPAEKERVRMKIGRAGHSFAPQQRQRTRSCCASRTRLGPAWRWGGDWGAGLASFRSPPPAARPPALRNAAAWHELVGDPLLIDEPPEDTTTVVAWIDTPTMLSDGLTKKVKRMQIDQAICCMLKGILEAEVSLDEAVTTYKVAEANENARV